MTSNLDYKKYSLDKLKEWIHDALSCGEASPHEIYSVIREAAQEDYQYYKEHSARAFGLLELMSGHRPVADKELFEAAVAEREYYEGTDKTLSCDKDDKSPECQKAWNDFWEENYYPEESKSKKKWILPVEEIRDEDSGENEYCVAFPDDLLEAANLKEGDVVEWVDQGDGSYLIKKVGNRTLNYKEAIEAGWEMTGDGFWLPPQKS